MRPAPPLHVLMWAVSLLALAALVRPTASIIAHPRSLRRRDGTRPVFAHVVQGDFQSYSQSDYAADMSLALSAGIDAFALNVGRDATDAAQLDKAFAAAEETSFKCFFSLDMNYFATEGASEAILEYVARYGGRSGHFEWEGKVFLSTFSGEVAGTFLDGASSFADSNAKWTTLLEQAKAKLGKEIYFAPDWNDASLIPQNTWGGGIMSWAAWGDKGRTGAMTTSQDESYLAAAASGGLGYLAPVAAFFYVHVAAGNNYVLQSNDFLLPKHYEALISLDPGPDFVELLSWNDFGESHYLGPVRDSAGIPNAAKKYVDSSRDHTPMLWLSAYWNVWFKTGSPPTITSEAVIWWHRPHPAAATASADSLDKPQYAETLEDKIQVVVFVPQGSKASKLVITTGGKATDAQNVKEGVNLVSVDFTVGATGVSLQHSSGTELLSGTGQEIVDAPATYDYNHYAYILPAGAKASSFLSGLSSTGTSSPAGSSTSSSQASAAGSGMQRAGASPTKGSSSSATSAPPAASGSSGSTSASSGSAGSGSSGASGGESASSAGDAASFLNGSGWLGFPTWAWLCLALVVPLAGLGIFLATRHGGAKPHGGRDEEERLVRARRHSDSGSSSSGGSGDH